MIVFHKILGEPIRSVWTNVRSDVLEQSTARSRLLKHVATDIRHLPLFPEYFVKPHNRSLPVARNIVDKCKQEMQ